MINIESTELIENKKRCKWVTNLEIDIFYHDNEWGKIVHDERQLFEMLLLELFQSGLSWITILKKREAFRKAFDNFEPKKIAKYDEEKIKQLMENKEIVRYRKKIEATINNAKKYLEIQKKYGSFDSYIWKYIENIKKQEEQKECKKDDNIYIDIAKKISGDLKKDGLKFLGTTTIYSFIQAIGMINDHDKNCFLSNK